MFWHKHKQHGPRGERRGLGPRWHHSHDGEQGECRGLGPDWHRGPNRHDGPEQEGDPRRHGMHGRHCFSPRGPGRHDGPFGRGGPFGGRPPFDEEGGGGRQRQRRGDIKFALLELLAEQPRHGYELIKALEQRYGGFYRPSPGSVYPTLQLLEDEGQLTSEVVEGKRTYSITESGRALLAEKPARDERWHGPGGRHRHMHEPRPELEQLRANTEGLLASVAQVAQHGSAEQAQQVASLLESTRRAVYRILAGDEASSE